MLWILVYMCNAVVMWRAQVLHTRLADLPTQEEGNECDFCNGVGDRAKRSNGGSVRGVPPHGAELFLI